MAPRKRLARSPAEFAEILSDPTAVGLLPDTPTEPVAYTPPAPPPAATPAAEEGSALLHGLGTIISLPGKAMEVVDAPFKALSRETYRRLFPEVSEEAIPSPGQMLAAAATGGGPPETLGEGVVRGGAEFAGDILTSPSTMALFSRALAGKIPSVAHKVLTAGLVGGIAEGIKNTYEKASEEGGLTPGVAETAMRPILDTALLVPGAIRERMARGAAAPGLEAGPAAPPPQIEAPAIRGFLGPGEGGDVAGTPGPPESPLRPFGGPGGAVGPMPPTEPPQVTKAKGVIRTVRDMVETGQATGAVDAVEKLGKATTLLQGVGPVGAEPEPVRERALAAAQAAVDALEAKIDRLWGIPAITPEEFATRQAGLQQLFSQREAARNDLARLQQAQTADEWRALMEARRNAPPMTPEAPGGGAPPVAAPGVSPAGPGAPPRAPVATMERPVPAAPAETPGADVRENAPARTQALLAQARDVTTGGTGEVLPPEAGVVGAAGPPRAAAGIPPGVSGPPPPTAGGFASPPAASPAVTPPVAPVAAPPAAPLAAAPLPPPAIPAVAAAPAPSSTGRPEDAVAQAFGVDVQQGDGKWVARSQFDDRVVAVAPDLESLARQLDEARGTPEGEQAPIPGSEPPVAPRYERTPEGEQALIPGSEVARGPMADVRGQGPLFDEAARDAEAETQATAALKEREAAARLERERQNAAAQTTLTIPPAEPATPRPAAEAEPPVAPEPAATEEAPATPPARAAEAGPPRATGGVEDVDLTEEQTAALGRWLGTRKVDPQGPQAAEITRAARLVRGAVQQHQRAAAERDAAYALKPTIKVRLSDQAGKKYHQSIRPVDVKRAREQAKDALEIARGVYQGAVDTLRASVRDVPGASFRSLLQIAENRMAARGGPGVLLKATGAEIAAMTEQLQHSPILFHTLTERAVAYTPEAAVSDDAVLRRMESIAKRGDELAALGGKPNWKAMAAAELAGVGERAVQDALHQGTRHPAFGKILEYQKREARERRALYEAAAEDGWGDGAEQDTYDAEAIRRHLATYRDGLAAELERIPEDKDPTLPWGVIDPATGVAVTARAALDALETKAGRLYARIVYAVSDSLIGTAEEGDDVSFDVPEGVEGEDLGPLEANEPPRFQGSLFSMPLGPASLREAKKAVDAREHRGYTRPDAAPRRGPEDDRGARAGVPGPVRPAGGPEPRLGGGTPVGRGEGGVHAAPGPVVRGVQEGARQPVFAIRTIRPTLTAVRPADPGLIPERLRPHLDENQQEGTARAIRAMGEAERGFMLADGTGVGKTREILATAAHFADKGHPVLIFAPAGVINVPDSGPDKGKVTGSYADDSAAMGVPVELLRFPMKVKAGPELQPGKVYLSAYELIGKQRVTKDTVVIFDEAHYIKNADKSARGEAGMAHARTAHAVLFSTATPGDQAHHLMYAKRIGLLEGKSEREALADLGMELATTTGKDGTARSFWKPKSIELMKKRIRELYGRLTEQGRMIKREVDFAPVEVDFRTAIPVSEGRAAELKKIADTWPGEDAISKRMKLMHQRRQLEPDKLPHVQRIIEEELASGRQVVVFAQRLRQSDVYKREYAMVNGERVLVSEEYITGSEGTLETLGKWLDEKGIPYATIHSETAGPKSEQIRRFQAGEAKVVIATVEAGGTGVSLDDRRGDAPRTLVMMTAPLESTSYLQAMGRVHRKPTMSTSRVIGLFSDHEADLWNQGIIVRKLELANAQVAGSVRRLNPELEGQVDVDSGETDLDLVSPQAGKPSKKQPKARIASGQVTRTLDSLVTWQGRTENPKRVHSEKQYRFHRRAIETMGGAVDASGDWQIPTTDGRVVRGILTHPREGGITGLFRYGPPERPADLGHLEANDHAVSVRAQLEALAAVADATRPLPAPHALAVGVGLNYDKDPNWDIVSTTIRKSFASNWSVRWKDFRNVQITSVHDLAAIAQIARNTSLEQAHFLLMKKGRIVTAVLSGAGLPGQTRMLPDGFTVDDLKETMRVVGADGYYLVHNHPDGLPTPSQTDIASTKKVADLIPGFLGHVIVDHGTYGTIEKADIDSMEPGPAGERKLYERLSRVKSRSAAWLTQPDPFLAEGVDPVAYWQTSEYDLRTPDQLLRAYARNLVRHAEEHPTWPLVILADSRRRFRAALSVSPSVYYDPEKFSAWLAQRNVEFGAVVAHVAVVGARRDPATLQYLRNEMVDLALDPVAAQRMAILGARDADIWNGAVTTPPADFEGFGANEPPPFDAGEEGPPEEPGGGGAGSEPPRDPPWGTGPGPDDEGWNRRATFAEARARAGGPWTGRRLRDALIAGVDRFKRGLRDFARWASSMDFGGIGPFLKRIWGKITDWFQPQMTTTTMRGEGAGPYDAAHPAGRRGPARPIPRVDPADVDAAARRMGQPPPEPRPGQERPPRSPLNLDRIVDEADIKAILRSIQESLGGKFKKAQGYRSWAEARQKALEAGLTEQDVMRLLREKGVLTDVEIDAIRLLRQEAGIDVSHKLAYLTDLRARLADAADPARRAALEQEALEAERDYRAALQRLIAISLTTKAAGAEAGRALAMHRRMMESLSPEERAMRRILRGLDPSERDTADLAEALRSGNMADLMRVVNRLRKPSVWGMFNEYFLNSILSGPSTLIANVAGNVSHEVLLRTPERGLAALFEEAGITQAIESLFGRGHGRAPERLSGEMREAGRALWKARLSFPEMLTFMKDALWNERTPTGVHGEWTPPSIPGVLGKVIRTPGRLMEALDQASKGSAARAERAAQLFRMAANEMKAGGESWSKERMRSRIDELDADLWRWQELDLSRRVNPRDLSREDAVFLARNRRFSAVVQAMEHAANVSTFRDAVHPLTRMLMTARARYPWLVPLVPFVRTPERILASALKRTPLGLVDALRKMQSGKLEGGAAADRLAQGVFGTAITLGLFAAAKAGYITGSGPVDPDERRNWLKTGKTPYAVKVGNTWVSMARIEPLATSLGFASDLAEAGDAKSAKDAFDKLHYAALNNVFNKTYLEGLINASQAMSDPDRYAAEFSKRLVGALVPNLLASAARAIDPTIRQTDDISSTLMARVPLLSEQLQPRLTGTGEEVKRQENAVSRFVSPVRYSTEAGPEADLERVFLDLGYNPSAPPRTARLPKSGRDYYLSPEERGYYADAAARATAFARGLVERPEWKDLNDYQKEEVLRRIYRFAHDVSRRKVYNSLYGRIWGGTATEKAK